MTCDRCLAEYAFTLAAPLQLIVELPEDDQRWRLQDLEIEVPAGEVDTLQVTEPVVDLENILRQQIFLALPAKQLCRPDCPGLCAHCGRNLQDGPCGCRDDRAGNSPFAVLAGYGKKKKQ